MIRRLGLDLYTSEELLYDLLPKEALKGALMTDYMANEDD